MKIMTYEFFSVMSGMAILQELEAANEVAKTMPLNLMLSYLYLRKKKKWAIPEVSSTYLDSGAYSQINNKGDYPFTMEEYVDFCNDHHFDFYSTLDYPCDERFIADLSITERIEMTVNNTAHLIDEIENLVPVIQGKTLQDYLGCIDAYDERGLIKDYMGIGSICIRKKTSEIVPLVMAIKKALPPNTNIHCYGLEIPSIKKLYPHIKSSDSHSWGTGFQLGGRVSYFNGSKLRSFPRNRLPRKAGFVVCLHAYNFYINHLTRNKGELHKFAV